MLSAAEYKNLAFRLSEKHSGNPTRTYQAVTDYFYSNDKFYRGHQIFVRPNLVDWESLIKQAEREKRKFITFEEHQYKCFKETNKNLMLITENRKLLNQLKAETKRLKNGN